MKNVLMVFCVMAIGVVIYGLFSPGCGSNKEARAESDFNGVVSALTMFETTTGGMPTTGEGLAALVTRPAGWPEGRRWTRLMDRVPLDPWGREYSYTMLAVDGKPRAKLRSAGPDGREGTTDDLERVKE